jgi:multidrug efflux pump subunit AcrA (membrane-fusion protein)
MDNAGNMNGADSIDNADTMSNMDKMESVSDMVNTGSTGDIANTGDAGSMDGAGNAGATGRVPGFLKKHRKLFIVLGVVLVLIIVGRIALLNSEAGAQSVAPPATLSLERMDIEQIVSATGNVAGVQRQQVSVPAMSSDKIVELNVAEGDVVQKGDVLCRLDTSTIDISIKNTQKSLSAARAQSSASLEQAERKLREAQYQYSLDADRLNGDATTAMNAWNDAKSAAETTAVAAADGAVAAAAGGAADGAAMQQKAVMDASETAWRADPTGIALSGVPKLTEYQNAKAAYEQTYAQAYNIALPGAQAAWQSAHDAALSAASASVSAAESAFNMAVQTRDTMLRTDSLNIENARDAVTNIKLNDGTLQLQAQLETYAKQKEDAALLAPIGGKLISVNAVLDTVPSGVLFDIEDTSIMEVTALVAEYDVPRLKEGLPVVVTTDASEGAEWEGALKSVSEAASDENGNFTVVVTVTDGADSLKSGMTASLDIVCDSRRNVYAVPYDALTDNADGDTVIYAYLPQNSAGSAAPGGSGASADSDSASSGNSDSETSGQGASGSNSVAQNGANAASSGGSASASSASQRANRREIVVKTGMESDYFIEIISSELEDGLQILTDPEGRNTSAAPANPFAFGG